MTVQRFLTAVDDNQRGDVMRALWLQFWRDDKDIFTHDDIREASAIFVYKFSTLILGV